MSVLEKLSNELGLCDSDKLDVVQGREISDNFESTPTNKQPSCLGDTFFSPAIKQPSCSGDTTLPPAIKQLSCSGGDSSADLRDPFEERLVEKLLSAQSKQFQELQDFVVAGLTATNERLDSLLVDDTDGEPPNKIKRTSPEVSVMENTSTTKNSVMENLCQHFDSKDRYGKPVMDDLVNILKVIFSTDISKADVDKKREEFIEKFLFPKNCEILSVPKVNKEIWRLLPASARNSDIAIQKPQTLIAHAIVPIVRVVEVLIKADPQGDNEETNETVNRLMEAISMMAMANDDLNHVRRNSIKPNLNADFRSLCSSQNAVTDNLFGDNITDQLKTIQEANKLGKKLSDEQSKSVFFSGNKKPFLGSRNSWTNGSRKRGVGRTAGEPSTPTGELKARTTGVIKSGE